MSFSTSISRGILTLLLFFIHGWPEKPAFYSGPQKVKTKCYPSQYSLRDLLKAWAAVILFRGSLFNNRFTKSFASEERAGQGCSSKLGSAFRTALKIPDSVRAQNGRLPHSRIYAITPILHTSASVVYDLCKTSGAT